MRKPKKVHLQDRSATVPVSVCLTPNPETTTDILEVTCLRCHRLAGIKTTEQGGPVETVDLIVTNTGPTVINFIKAVRELSSLGLGSHHWSPLLKSEGSMGTTYFGLKESKDFADAIRYGNQPQTLLKGVGPDIAEQVGLKLKEVGATVQIVVAGTTRIAPNEADPEQEWDSAMAKVRDITKAYREMLALFLPNQKHVEMLDDLDDDEKTGHRLWPIMDGKTPRMADVRRWLAAGGGQIS